MMKIPLKWFFDNWMLNFSVAAEWGWFESPRLPQDFCGSMGIVASASPHKALPLMSLGDLRQGPRIVAKDLDFKIMPNSFECVSGV